MSLSQSRAVLRRPQFLFRQRFAAPSRNASTTEVAKEKASEASSKASEVTSNATSKASEGLTRVSSSANSVANRASGAASGGIGRAIGFVQCKCTIRSHLCKAPFCSSACNAMNCAVDLSSANVQCLHSTLPSHGLLLESRLRTWQDDRRKPQNGSSVCLFSLY